METFYDWVTVMLFAGLVTHFLANSVRSDEAEIPLWQYLLLSCGCALANWLGNEGHDVLAVAVLLGGATLAWRLLRSKRPGGPH